MTRESETALRGFRGKSVARECYRCPPKVDGEGARNGAEGESAGVEGAGWVGTVVHDSGCEGAGGGVPKS